jgi:hypothetical protein
MAFLIHGFLWLWLWLVEAVAVAVQWGFQYMGFLISQAHSGSQAKPS